jgi:hypothetical protein
MDEGLRRVGGEFAVKNPEARAYAIDDIGVATSNLGFDHIVDVLKQDLAAGRIRPEQLNKVSMEQAVRRTYDFDQEMAKRMREAQIKATEGMPVHKEYPEGYRWIELRSKEPEMLPEGVKRVQKSSTQGGLDVPGYGFIEAKWNPKTGLDWERAEKDAKKALSYKPTEDALKYEGDTMGHCVGGYCPDVLEGRSRIYSLRDAKGEPHVTIETSPMDNYELKAAQMKRAGASNEEIAAFFENPTQKIFQIKGKQNKAPNEQYLPYVQDFVRGGQWSDVGDFKNTGLYRKGDFIDEFTPEQLDAVGKGEYLTMDEIKKLREGKTWKPIDTDPDLDINLDDLGMKAGGEVKMAAGGIAKLKALLREAAVLSIEQPWNAIARIIQSHSPRECTNYFAAVGYDAD